jgi:predicted Zn-dependent protease
MKDEKSKRDEYQKTLAVYAEAMKEFRKGKFDKAVDMLRAFMEKYPAEHEFVDRARTYIAVAEERLRQTKEAVSPKTADDFFHYAVFKLNNGENEEALKLLEKAQKLSPDEGKIPFLMAQAFCASGQAEASLEALRKAIQIDKFFSILAQNESALEPLWEDRKFKLLTRIA